MSELMARHDDIYKKRFLRVSDYIFSFVEERRMFLLLNKLGSLEVLIVSHIRKRNPLSKSTHAKELLPRK